NGLDDEALMKYTNIAYPHLSESQVKTLFEQALVMRDMPMRLYMRELVSTDDNFQFKSGALASFDLMKAGEGKFSEYEKAETDVLWPLHEKRSEQRLIGHWCFMRTALPLVAESKSTHLPMNIYRDYMQFFNAQADEDLSQSAAQREAVNEGLKSRDQKWVYLATLENVVR